MWTLEYPETVLLLLLVPILVWFGSKRRDRGSQVPLAFGAWAGPSFRQKPGLLYLGWKLSRSFFWLGIVLLIVALSGPTLLTKEKLHLNRGYDIIFAVDISPSMGARDEPDYSRLDLAKREINNFLAKRGNDAIGLVAFGSDAALYCPPTLDYASFRTALGNLAIMDLGDGTAIGLGLSVASVHLKQSSGQSRVVILLSDGDNNAGEISPDLAASMLEAENIKLYTVGMGSDQEVYIEYESEREQKLYRGSFQSRLDEKLLDSLARTTGGRYFYSGTGNGLSEVLGTISDLETSESRVRQNISRQGLHWYFILAAFMVLLLDLIIQRFIFKELS